MTTAEHRLLTPEEVGKLLQCSVKTVVLRARRGDLPGLQFGTGWVFPAEALYQRLNELALEEAHLRVKPVARKAPREVPRPAAVLHTVPRRKGAPPSVLPVLPELP